MQIPNRILVLYFGSKGRVITLSYFTLPLGGSRGTSREGGCGFGKCRAFLCIHPRPRLLSPLQFAFQPKMPCDPSSNFFRILLDIFIREPKNIPTERLELTLPLQIGLHHMVVVATIDFNHQSHWYTREINDPFTDGILPPEFQSANLAGSQ